MNKNAREPDKTLSERVLRERRNFNMGKMGTLVLAISALAYLWFSSYHILLNLSLSTLLAGISIYFAFLQFLVKRKIPLDKDFQRLLIVSFSLLAWSTFVYAIFEIGLPKRWGQILLGIAIAASVYILVDTYPKAKFLIKTMIIGGTISAVVGIGQFFLGEPFWRIWQTLIENKIDSSLISYAKRIPGLAPTPITFGYHMATIIPLSVAFFHSLIRGKNKFQKVLIILATTGMIFGIILGGYRAALGGASLGISVVMFLLHSKKKQWRYVLSKSIILSIIVYLVIGWLYNPIKYILLRDISAKARLPMLQTAILYALRHPFGTGYYEIEENIELVYVEDPAIAEIILKTTPHNQFLNVLIYYGFPGLLLLIIYYWLCLKTTYKLWKNTANSNSLYLKWLPAGIFGALLGYLVNSMTHNAGPFVGDIFHWYLIGLIFSVLRIVKYSGVRKQLPRNYEGS